MPWQQIGSQLAKQMTSLALSVMQYGPPLAWLKTHNHGSG